MSAATACGWSLSRSLLVAVLATPLAWWLWRTITSLSGAPRRFVWCVLAMPLLFPGLLSGYAYSGVILRWIGTASSETATDGWNAKARGWLSRHDTALDELLLITLLVTKAVPVGTMLLIMSPRPPYSQTAWHCRQIAFRDSSTRWMRWRTRLDYVRHGPARSIPAALGLVFLVTFQEFELPSLLNRPAWTVWLFDAQPRGLAIAESLRAAVPPVVCQLFIAVPLWRGLVRYRADPGPSVPVSATRPMAVGLAAIYLGLAVFVASVVPLLLVGQGIGEGFQALLVNRGQMGQLVRRVGPGTVIAIVAAVMSLGLAEFGRKAGWRRHGLAALALPGFFGPLILCLVLVRLFQSDWLHRVYDTPAALLLGLVLWLLPRAILLEGLLQGTRAGESRHAAELLLGSDDRRRKTARELAWRLGQNGRFWCVALLAWWGYLELTVGALLSPSRMASMPVLLYNQMHFGKNAVLSASTALAVLPPVLLFVGAAALRPLLNRWIWR